MKVYQVFLSLLALFILMLTFILFDGCSNKVSEHSGKFSASFSAEHIPVNVLPDNPFVPSAKV